MANPSPLQDSAVVVTGATGALGTAVCRAFVDAGARVFGTFVHDGEIARFDAALGAARGSIELVRTDVVDEASVAALFQKVDGHGRLGAVVHVAGGFAMGALDAAPVATWDAQMGLNAKSFFLVAREAVRRMKAQKSGSIVAVGSRGGVDPSANAVLYGASKAALHAMVRGLGDELKGTGVSVNAVLPSTIDTPANRASMPDADFSRWVRPEAIATTIVALTDGHLPRTSGALVPVYGDA